MQRSSNRRIEPFIGQSPPDGPHIRQPQALVSRGPPTANAPIQTNYVSVQGTSSWVVSYGSSEPNVRNSYNPSGFGVQGEPHSSEGSDSGRRRVIQRQSHTKSRNGCFSCKRRRIKASQMQLSKPRKVVNLCFSAMNLDRSVSNALSADFLASGLKCRSRRHGLLGREVSQVQIP